jgi:hypothetical protein
VSGLKVPLHFDAGAGCCDTGISKALTVFIIGGTAAWYGMVFASSDVGRPSGDQSHSAAVAYKPHNLNSVVDVVPS